MNDNRVEIGIPGECAPLDLYENTERGSDDELAALAKAIAHPARLQIVRLLSKQGTCVCGEIVDELPFAQSTVSEHLRILKEAGLIHGKASGARMCYYLDPEALARLKTLVQAL